MAILTSFIRRHLPLRPRVKTETTESHVSQDQQEPTPSSSGPLRSVEEDLPSQTTETKPVESPPSSKSRATSPARVFPSSGFQLIDKSVRLEEEAFQWYSPKKFYAPRIGEVFQETYQVITKLGYGTASTTWLCRDLR